MTLSPAYGRAEGLTRDVEASAVKVTGEEG